MAAQNPSLTLSSGEAAYRRARIGIVGGSVKTGYALDRGCRMKSSQGFNCRNKTASAGHDGRKLGEAAVLSEPDTR